MPKDLGQTVAALARFQEMARQAAAAGHQAPRHMKERRNFGSNPGELRMLIYAPAGLPPGAPLVVVLHGCSQEGDAYAAGAGWLALADRLGFAVVAADQSIGNNANRCFNWFEPEDVARGRGEAASIRQMVETAIGDCDLDPARVFVTGLSAGGAMTAAMLAAYPEVFAGGAVVAGLPYGAADDVMSAFSAMFQPHPQRAGTLGDRVREAGPPLFDGPWPRVSIWHGDADGTVQFANAGELVKQWTDVHDIDRSNPHHDRVDGQRHTVWSDAAGRPMVELYTVHGMGHGTPLASTGLDGLGAPGPYLLEVGVSSTARIAAFWGLGEAALVAKAAAEPPTPAAVAPARPARPRASHPAVAHPGDVIAKALAAAGLIKR
jgi:poly(hydroxyalkanoate) depolymerase family esterase